MNNMEQEKKGIAEEIIEKEMAKVQEKEIENKVADYNFIISQNKVLFVDKITNKDIKNGGKFSQGQNYYNGDTVQILDKDY